MNTINIIIPKWLVAKEMIMNGDIIHFQMPGFCSGYYNFKILKHNNNFIIKDAPNRIFEGMVSYSIERNGVIFENGKPYQFENKFECLSCGKLYIIKTSNNVTKAKCPSCGLINKKTSFTLPIDEVIWHLKYSKQ